jgi:bisphosphoglycerate-independent phosphoglycerate mutase (AlkP superfamily)
LSRRFPLVTLVILDGRGLAPPGPGNAVSLADTAVFDRPWEEFPPDHVRALLRFAPERTWIHAFSDGRDVSPHAEIHDLATLPVDRISTVSGRYYGMDRDKRWERARPAFDAVTRHMGTQAQSVLEAVQASYAAGVADEFVVPNAIDGVAGARARRQRELRRQAGDVRAGARGAFCAGVGHGYAAAIVDFANPDMVGHTGVIPAVVEAVETADRALGRVVERVTELGGVCLVTADHGNAETMLEPDGLATYGTHDEPGAARRHRARGARDGGELADLAPTILPLLGLERPLAMRGKDLVRS